MNTEEFIKRSKEVHGDKYDYSRSHYYGSRTPVIISCPVHGWFTQAPSSHYNGHGCKECGRDTVSEALRGLPKGKKNVQADVKAGKLVAELKRKEFVFTLLNQVFR